MAKASENSKGYWDGNTFRLDYAHMGITLPEGMAFFVLDTEDMTAEKKPDGSLYNTLTKNEMMENLPDHWSPPQSDLDETDF